MQTTGNHPVPLSVQGHISGHLKLALEIDLLLVPLDVRRGDVGFQLPALSRVQRIVGMIQRERSDQAHGDDADLSGLLVDHLGAGHRCPLGDIAGGPEPAGEVGADHGTLFGVGGGHGAEPVPRQLQRLAGCQEVRGRPFHAGAAVDGREPGFVGQGVRPAEPVEVRPAHVEIRTFAGGITGGEVQGVLGPFRQVHHHRPKGVGRGDRDSGGRVRSRGQRHRDAVIDAGIQQAMFQLGNGARVVDLSRLPGRELADEGRIGPLLRIAEGQPADMDELVGLDIEGRAHAGVGMINHYVRCLRPRVGIAPRLQDRHDPGLGLDHVLRPG